MNMKTGMVLLSAALLSGAYGAEINWMTYDITGYASDVVTNGSLIEAINGAHSGVTASPTINGVEFTSTGSLLGGNWSGDAWDPTVSLSDYNTLLSTIDFEGSDTGAYTLKTFSGLTVGQQYIIQIWHADSDAGAAGRTMTYTGSGQNELDGESYAIGSFIADATTQDLVVTASQSGPRLTAYQFRHAPDYEGPTNPILQVSPDHLTFGRTPTGSTNNLTLLVKNSGWGSLDGAASVAAPFSITSGAAYSLTHNQEQVITVQFIPPEADVFSESITFTGGDGANISISGRGVIPGTNDPVTVESLLNQMVDRSEIARFPDPSFRLINFSSYNRASEVGPPESGVSDTASGWFANGDYNGKYLYTTTEYGHGTEYVMVDHQAPGALVRFWTPWRSTKSSTLDDYVRIYLDGSTTPVIEGNMLTLFDGTGLIPYPFGHPSLRSAVSFFPITYQDRCVITLDRSPFFYIFTHREYDQSTEVETFTMNDYNAAATLIASSGTSLLDPEARVPDGREVSSTTSISAGEEAALELPAGGNAVHEFTVEVTSTITPQLLRSLIVKAEFDGMETVWCPLSDFFGSGVGLHPFEGWYRTVDADGTFSCRWVMPYQENARIALENISDSSVDVTMHVVTAPWSWNERSMYFHSAWRSQYPLPTRPWSDWNYITLSGGRGVYVGDTLTIWNPVTSWWGEGDHKIWVDGDTFPSLFGTGTEDYYAYSWGGRSTDFYEHPFHGQIQCNVYDKLNRHPNSPGFDANTYGYSVETRSRALDGIAFTNDLKLDMEIWHGTDVDMDYAVALHWYADVGTADNRSPDYASALQTVWDETSEEAALYVSVPEVDFGFIETGAVTSITVTVQNRGGATLNGTVSAEAPFSVVSGGSYRLDTAEAQDIVLQFSPSAIGGVMEELVFSGGGGASIILKGHGYINRTTETPDSRMADLREDYIATDAGGSTADFNSGEGLSDLEGSGRWNYYESNATNSNDYLDGSTLELLQFDASVGTDGNSGYGNPEGGSYSVPVLADGKCFSDAIALESNKLAFHPANDADGASMVARWTAGSTGAGWIQVVGEAGRGAGNVSGGDGRDFYIFKSSRSGMANMLLFQHTFGAVDTTSLAFDVSTSLIEGEHIDFVVNRMGDYAADEMHISAEIFGSTGAVSSDSDADQLPDLWESKWVSNLTDLSGDGDFDGDGVSDAQEYASGTDPLDANDSFVITDFEPTANGPRVKWTTEPGFSYRVDRSIGLASNGWTTVASGVTSGVWIDSSPAAQNQKNLFYRFKTE